MKDMEMEQPKMPTLFNVRVLADGTLILSSGINDEYAYDSVDELLAGLRDDLENAVKDSDVGEDESAKRKKNVAKLMPMEDDDNEKE